jgi:hypothetical protein
MMAVRGRYLLAAGVAALNLNLTLDLQLVRVRVLMLVWILLEGFRRRCSGVRVN